MILLLNDQGEQILVEERVFRQCAADYVFRFAFATGSGLPTEAQAAAGADWVVQISP